MHLKGIIYLGVALLTFAFTHITDKLGMNSGVDPAVFSFFRIFVGLVVVGIVWFALRKKKKLLFRKKYIKNLVIIGTLASGLLVLLVVGALMYTTATNRGIMQGMYSVGTAIFAYFMLKEKLPKIFFPTLIVMIIGLVLLTSKGLLGMPNKGDWILFATIPLVGFNNAYVKKTMRNMTAITAAFGRYIFGALFLLLVLPFFGLEKISTLSGGIEWATLSGILSGVRVLAFYKGIKIVGPTIAASVLTVAPAITALAAFFILGETLNYLQIMGLVLVLSGAIIISQVKATYGKEGEDDMVSA